MRQSISLSIESIGRYLELLKNSIITFYKYPLKKELCIQQLFEIGVLSLPAIAISGFSTGLVLAAQSFFQLADKGLESSTGIMVAKSMVTELGPILAGFIVTGRVGSSISAEIGSMKVTEQIDAMESMSVSPLQYLLIPRILAAALMQPILTIFNCVMGIFGAYLISVYFFYMPPLNFLTPIPDFLTYFDVFTGLFKAFIFGIILSTIACYKGFQTQGGAYGVGKSITQGVVMSYSVILIFNFIITIGLNMLRLRWMYS